MPKQDKKAFYAVGIGRNPGIYSSWRECKSQVDGVSNPKFRKFYTALEAEQFVNEWKQKNQSNEKSGCNPFVKKNNIFPISNETTVNVKNDSVCGNILVKEEKSCKGEQIFQLSFLSHSSRLPLLLNCRIYVISVIKHGCLSNSTNLKVLICKKNKNPLFIYLPALLFKFFRYQNLFPKTNFNTCTTGHWFQNKHESRYYVLNDKSLLNNMSLNFQKRLLLPCKYNLRQYINFIPCSNIDNKIQVDGYFIFFRKVNSTLNLAMKKWNKIFFSACHHMNSLSNCMGNSCLQQSYFIKYIMSHWLISCCFNFIYSNICLNHNLNLSETLKYGRDQNRGKLERIENGDSFVNYIFHATIMSAQNLMNLQLRKFTISHYHAPPKVVLLKLSKRHLEIDAEESGCNCLTEISFKLYSYSPDIFEGESSYNKDSGDENNVSIEKLIAVLREKTSACEKKIDSCMNKIGLIVSDLADATSDLRYVTNIINKEIVPVLSNNQEIRKNPCNDNSPVSHLSVMPCSNEKTYGSYFKSNTTQKVKFESELVDQRECKKQKKARKDDSEDSDLTDIDEEDIKLNGAKFTIEDGYVVVYTDGSCFSNGQSEAKAGIGVWFGDDHPLNTSKPVSGKATNNYAETQAAITAIELALNAGVTKLKIYTDSTYLLKSATEWMAKWKRNGWRTYDNEPVKNMEELQRLDRLMSQLSVRWEKVAGHSGIRGNEMADKLANEGAAFYKT